jgi:hypothetical protein
MPDDDRYDRSADPDDFDPDDYDGAGDGTLDASDTLDGDPGDDPLDTGIVTSDRWSAGEGYGTTLSEERRGESLEQLLAEEEPEPDPYAEEDLPGDAPLGKYEPEPRSGRLVAEDEGAHQDEEADLVARDVGIDGGAASAEEAAVHVEDEAD